MDRTQLAVRLVAELAAARTAITTSYLRLWSPAERTLTDPDAANLPYAVTSDREAGEAPEERTPRGSGSPSCRAEPE